VDVVDVDEDQMLAGVRAGQPDWAAIYAAYRADMMRVAIGVLGASGSVRGDDADDVVAKTMVELMRKGLPTDLRSVRAFLLRAIRRRAVDVTRGEHLDQELEPDLAATALEVEEAAVDAVILEQLLAAMPALDASERHAIEQRLMHNRLAKEVAEEIGVAPQYLPRLIRKAFAKLRAESGFTDHDSFDQDVENRSTESGDRGGPR
jgi:RNA polymerase sigma factor (sigma-70 family)